MFLRHAAPNRDAFAGGRGGRWGDTFPVIYLGRPLNSCIEEAYRHLVDEAGIPAHLVRARTLYSVRVDVTNVLDLRGDAAVDAVDLSQTDLESAVGDYERCQRVAAAAHQLEYHGIIAPAATGQGETLALFRQRLSATEMPTVIDREAWTTLPPRPGTSGPALRIVRS
ncbi:RES family NAD+ phosphorylase [Gordonia bronchialis]|uniref:RES family NAD+ phosphorylase n=1 Tax=Gordonia bronchialis TaxID=2054 RepID=UPI001D13B9E2|nr:RES family NAD+ phosphorylase [Gordonia bronchialis]